MGRCLYTRPYDPLPSRLFDESNKQLIVETIEPLPIEPGQPQHMTTNMNVMGYVICSCFSEP